MKKYKSYFLAFLIPMLILIIYVLIRGIKMYSLIIADSGEQYIFLFDYLKSIFNGDNSIFYFLGRGLGGTMFSTFFYYLSSPLNLFLILFKSKDVHLFMIILSLIKISLSSLTMYMYLKKHNSNEEWVNIIFSCLYALMSYNVVYHFQIMWQDVIYLLPLILNGLDKILENKKSKSYIFFFFTSILCNYYLSYMLSIFLTLYFIYRLLSKYDLKKDKKVVIEIIKKFIISSLLSVLLASFFLLPIINELKNVYRDELIFDTSYISNPFNLLLKFSIVKSLYHSSSNYFPHVFCGFLPIVVMLNYFIKIKDKNKKYVLWMFLVLLLSFVLIPLVIIWHGFDIPAYLFHRWAFMFSAFLIITAAEKWKSIKKMPLNMIIKISICYFIILLFSYIFNSIVKLDMVLVIINSILFLLTFIIVNKTRGNVKKSNIIMIITLNIATVFILLYSCFEANATLTVSENIIDNRNSYLENRYKFKEVLTNLENDYYRIGGNIIYTTNETFGLINGRNQLFLSSNQRNLIEFYQKSGYAGTINEYIDKETQTVLNTLLGVKYWYNGTVDENFNIIENSNIYKNKYDFKIGYLINYKETILDDTNPFEYQNSIFKSIYGEDIWKKYNIGQTYISADNYIYLYADGYMCDKNEYLLINTTGGTINFCDEYGILKIDVDTIMNFDFGNKDVDFNNVYLYYLDHAAMQKMFDYFKDKQIDGIKVDKNTLDFHIENKEDSMLLLTIPYDEGWHIYIDGQETDYFQIIDTFIGINLIEGNHQIKMIYYPKGLSIGLIISFIDLIVVCVYFKKSKYCFVTKK